MNDHLDESKLKALGLRLLASSNGSSVAIVEKLWKYFTKKFPRQDQRSLVRWMKNWCDGEHHMPPERFKMLSKENGYRIDEFKSYQSRAYGVATSISGKRIFVVTELDLKKQDVADPAAIKRAARLAEDIGLEKK
jgi:hypothetical protein